MAYTLASFFRRFGGAIGMFLVIRYVDVSDYATYASFTNSAQNVLVFASFGLGEWAMVSTGAHKARAVERSVACVFISIAIFIILALSLSRATDNNRALLVFIMIRQYSENVICMVLMPYFQCNNKFTQLAIIDIVYTFAILSTASLCYMFKTPITHYALLLAIIGFTYTTTLLVITRKWIKTSMTHIFYFFTNFDKSILLYGTSVVMAMWTQRLMPLIISYRMPAREVAIFFCAFQISSVALLLSKSIRIQIFASFVSKDGSALLKSILKAISLIVIANLFLCIMSVVFGKELLLYLFSNRVYAEGHTILSILLLSNITTGIWVIFNGVISAKGHQIQRIRFQAEGLCIGAISSYYLLVAFGIIGFAYGILIMGSYISIRAGIFVIRIINTDSSNNIKYGRPEKCLFAEKHPQHVV